MCGINGIFSFAGPPVVQSDIESMRDRMIHRGPDGCGLWLSPDARIGFGHRRLSIIDRSAAAAQPMPNENGSIQIVFNGEIYNHAELRGELKALGHDGWKTDHSDTEVIVQAYEQWGIDCVHHFRGMFAFALWDARVSRLWLVRDRVGIKPLYYVRLPGQIAFASEIKGLLALPAVPRRVDEESLYNYLSFLVAPAPRTMFSGVEKLAAGTRMSVDASGAVRTERYWSPWSNASSLDGLTERHIADRVLDELRSAVGYRKVGDVPVGVFLSGGIDSSVNTALFAANGDETRTFSIGYDGEYASCRDELGDARRMASLAGATHHERRLTEQNMLDVLDLMVFHQDEPIGDAVCVPLYYVAKLAHDAGVTVCQVGEGSDELFCGYPFWRNHLRLHELNALPVPRFAKQAALGALAMIGRQPTYSYELVRRAAGGEPTFWGGAEGLTAAEKHVVLGGEMKAQFAGASSADVLEPIRRDFLECSWEPSALNWMTHLDLSLRLPELLLMRVDKMTMATSVEARAPFLDHKLIELALSIPSAVKIGDGELKRVLKMAVRGVVPNDVIDRPKQGFGVPMEEWMARGLGKVVRSTVLRFAETTGMLDSRTLPAFLDTAHWSKAWLLFNLAAWHDRFIANAG